MPDEVSEFSNLLLEFGVGNHRSSSQASRCRLSEVLSEVDEKTRVRAGTET